MAGTSPATTSGGRGGPAADGTCRSQRGVMLASGARQAIQGAAQAHPRGASGTIQVNDIAIRRTVMFLVGQHPVAAGDIEDQVVAAHLDGAFLIRFDGDPLS